VVQQTRGDHDVAITVAEREVSSVTVEQSRARPLGLAAKRRHRLACYLKMRSSRLAEPDRATSAGSDIQHTQVLTMAISPTMYSMAM
jgi:hypothetical protein